MLLKSILTLITAFLGFLSAGLITMEHEKYVAEIINLEPISIILFVTSLSSILGVFYHAFTLSFTFKHKKLSKRKKQFSIPFIFKLSIIILSLNLYGLFIIAQINKPLQTTKSNWGLDLLIFIIMVTVATWLLIDLYYTNKKLKHHNATVTNELEQIGL